MTVLSFQDIGLRPAQMRAVGKKAKHIGQTAPEYVRSLVEQDLLADKSFDEILHPIREDIRGSEITESQLDQIVNRARQTTSNGRRSKSRKARR
jgi:hypothetical protein